ncbi:MAG TPA: sugar transferase [Candidatus Krumholzibacteria bacterium]|nr:sugar transferase [Candidatus Krumholzibacteria bacterium]
MFDSTAQATTAQPGAATGRVFDFSPWTHLQPLTRPAAGSAQAAGGPGILERAVALALLAGVSPLLALIALALKLESPGGSVFYRQERVGLDRRQHTQANGARLRVAKKERRQTPGGGQRFLIWKFRTMIPNAEAVTGPVWAEENDPRVTRVGRALRTLRFDELPQLLNVVHGTMRLIGPRPERPQFVERLARAMPEYSRRHAVPPGITGLAQVQRNYDASLDDVRTKLKYDLYYVDNRCWMLNVKIVMKTFDVVFRGRGAH